VATQDRKQDFATCGGQAKLEWGTFRGTRGIENFRGQTTVVAEIPEKGGGKAAKEVYSFLTQKTKEGSEVGY